MSFVDIRKGGIIRKMREIRQKGELIPVRFGYESWNDYDKGKLLMGSRKVTMLIGGEPNHGKSTFANELVMQLIEKHHFKIALFTTESGDVEKVFSYFCGLYQGKSYAKLRTDGKPNPYAMTDKEAEEAELFLADKLYIFKQDRKDSSYQSLENIYKQLAEAEKDFDIKFDTLVIDPIYDVDDFEPKASEVLRCLNRINLEAEENNRFDIIVNHVAETGKMTDKNGNRKKLIALADEFYGGKNNQRKAQLMVLVHRPTATVDYNNRYLTGMDGAEVVFPNQTDIKILKVKPDGIAKWGTYPLFYDFTNRRYYEMIHDEKGFRKQFPDCVKFRDREPDKSINVNDFKLTPNEAFETRNFYEREEREDDSMPF